MEGCIVTSVNSVEQYNINIFQNPAYDQLHIYSPENEISKVVVYSSLGQKVLEQVILNTETDISLSEFSAGIYWIDVALRNGGRYTEKVMVLDW